jgi:signal peptidase II
LPDPTSTATKASAPKVRKLALVALAIVAVCVYTIDQVTKFFVTENLVEGRSVEVLGQLLSFHFVKNPGAAFSLFSNSTWVFAIIASGVAVFIVVFAPRIRSIAWAVLFGLLLGGNLGNLTDRLFREPSFAQGHVIDFIQIYGFPAIFNVADMGIVFSMALFIFLTVRGVGLNGERTISSRKTETTSGRDAAATDAGSNGSVAAGASATADAPKTESPSPAAPGVTEPGSTVPAAPAPYDAATSRGETAPVPPPTRPDVP